MILIVHARRFDRVRRHVAGIRRRERCWLTLSARGPCRVQGRGRWSCGSRSDERSVCILCVLHAVYILLDAVRCAQDPSPGSLSLRSRCGRCCLSHCVCLSTHDVRGVCETRW